MTQTELSARLGGVPQTTISRWEAGLVDLTYEQVYRLEVALDAQHGSLSMAAGYLAQEIDRRDIEAIIRSDKYLFPELREHLVRMYRTLVTASRDATADVPHTKGGA